MRALLVLVYAASAAAAPNRAPCKGDPRSLGFDYWLGVWDVRRSRKLAKGAASENRITLEQGGCVVQEHWRSAEDGPGAGYTGTSFTVFDQARAVWHQTWVDNLGGLAVFEGNVDANGNLVLHRIALPGDKDPGLSRRMSYLRQTDGGVRPLVERSRDAGATWTTEIDLLYVKRR